MLANAMLIYIAQWGTNTKSASFHQDEPFITANNARKYGVNSTPLNKLTLPVKVCSGDVVRRASLSSLCRTHNDRFVAGLLLNNSPTTDFDRQHQLCTMEYR